MKTTIDLDLETKEGIIYSDDFENIREHFSVANKARAMAPANIKRHIPKRNYMISQTGRFSLGNMNSIYDYIKKYKKEFTFNVTPDAKHHYEPSFNVPKDFLLPTHFQHPFRDTQEKGIRRAIQRGRGIINATTRSGKSYVIMGLSHVIRRYSPSTTIMIYVPNNICTQLFEEFIENGFIEGDEVSLWHTTYKNTNFKSPILIVSMTIAVSNEDKFEEFVKHRNVAMVDECHRIKLDGKGNPNKTTQRFLSMPTNNVIGFTGTIPKEAENRWCCLGNIGKVIQVVTDKEARDKGYKSETQVISMKLKGSKFRKKNKYEEKEDGTKEMVKLSHTELYQQKKEYLLTNDAFNSYVVDFTLKVCKGNTLITTEWDFQEEELWDRFKDCGRKVVMINGSTPQEERDVIFKSTRNEKDTILIVKIGAIQEGVTINGLDYFVGHYLGKSFTRVMQAVGRIQGLSKKKATLVDFYSDLDVSERHYEERKEYYKDAEYSLIEKVVDIKY